MKQITGLYFDTPNRKQKITYEKGEFESTILFTLVKKWTPTYSTPSVFSILKGLRFSFSSTHLLYVLNENGVHISKPYDNAFCWTDWINLAATVMSYRVRSQSRQRILFFKTLLSNKTDHSTLFREVQRKTYSFQESNWLFFISMLTHHTRQIKRTKIKFQSSNDLRRENTKSLLVVLEVSHFSRNTSTNEKENNTCNDEHVLAEYWKVSSSKPFFSHLQNKYPWNRNRGSKYIHS